MRHCFFWDEDRQISFWRRDWTVLFIGSDKAEFEKKAGEFCEGNWQRKVESYKQLCCNKEGKELAYNRASLYDLIRLLRNKVSYNNYTKTE